MTTENNVFDLSGKVALVSGASSGLGANFAKALASAGATVIAGARRKQKLDSLVEEITAAGGKARAVELDVTNPTSVSNALNTVEEEFGAVQILVNNAGVANSQHSLKVLEEDWDFIMNTNLKAVWHMAQTVAQRAIAAETTCSIINIASILGLRVGFGQSTYAVSKAAVVQLTKALALELVRKGVRVNAICPGYFATEMNSDYLHSEAGQKFLAQTPSGRMGEIEELNGPLLLLASDASSFMNGAIIPVDGGHVISSL